MQGSLFVSISPDPKTPGRAMIRLGTVKALVGQGQWLLEFQGKGYRFSNVLSADKLTNFAFFDSPAARQQFIDELMESNAAPVVTEEAPSAA